MKKYSKHILSLILTLCLCLLIFTRVQVHDKIFSETTDKSLESTNGYIQITIDLAAEMESQYQLKYLRKRAASPDSARGVIKNLLLSDPPVKGGKVQKNKDESLILTDISQDSSGIYQATFDYQGHSFIVKTGEKLLGRIVRKITAEKVYMNSTLMLFLYDINGKRLVKKKA